MGTKKTTTKEAARGRGRPKSILEKRMAVRTTPGDQIRWEAMADLRGYNGAGQLLRKLAEEAYDKLPASERQKIERAVSEHLEAA